MCLRYYFWVTKVNDQEDHFKSDSNGLVVRASAGRAVDLGLVPSRVIPMTFKLVFTASLLDAQHEKDSVENKSARLLVVPLGKALSEILPT